MRVEHFVIVVLPELLDMLGEILLSLHSIVHPKKGTPWSLLRWHWLRHYHRTRAHVSKIRREVSKMAMGHAADAIHGLSLPKTPSGSLGPGKLTIVGAREFNVVRRAAKASAKMLRLQNTTPITRR